MKLGNFYESMTDAVRHYERFGFRYIEAPWAVPERIMTITSPKDAALFHLTDGNMLVASGEQSLLHLIEEGKILTAGKYQTVTPCFRDDAEDEIHRRYFLKNELMIFRPDHPERELAELLNMCFDYFVLRGGDSRIAIVENPDIDGCDIECNGIEVGSYGIRTHRDYTWVYGTGRAEPRFSIASHACT